MGQRHQPRDAICTARRQWPARSVIPLHRLVLATTAGGGRLQRGGLYRAKHFQIPPLHHLHNCPRRCDLDSPHYDPAEKALFLEARLNWRACAIKQDRRPEVLYIVNGRITPIQAWPDSLRLLAASMGPY